jgi:hypothetical protein
MSFTLGARLGFLSQTRRANLFFLLFFPAFATPLSRLRTEYSPLYIAPLTKTVSGQILRFNIGKNKTVVKGKKHKA